jgi:hypothetical protein
MVRGSDGSRERAAECLARGDLTDTVEWLRHELRRPAGCGPGPVADAYAALVEGAILNGLAGTAAEDAIAYGESAELLDGNDAALLRAAARMVRGDVAAGLTVALPLLVRRGEVAATAYVLRTLGRFLAASGRPDLAARCEGYVDDLGPGGVHPGGRGRARGAGWPPA